MKPHSKAILLCGALLVLRAVARLSLPDIWAEDGTVFIKEALEQGVGSLLVPYAGYYHTAQRLIALGIVHLFPVVLWPIAIMVFCLVAYVLLATRLVLPEYAWLISSERKRIYCALFLCLLPGTQEVVGNLANLNWILVLSLGLIGLKDPKSEMSVGEILFSVIVVLSSATFFTLIPLFIWRMFVKKREVAIPAILVAGQVFLVATSLSDGHGLGSYHPEVEAQAGISEILDLGPTAYVKTFIRMTLLRPWLGPGFTFRILRLIPQNAILGWFLLSFLLAGMCFYAYRKRSPCDRAIGLFVFGISTWPIVACVYRPSVLLKFLAGDYWDGRYAFAMGMAGLLFWMERLGRLPVWNKKRPTFFGIFLALSVLHGLDRFAILPYRFAPYLENNFWTQSSELLQKSIETHCPQNISIPIYPRGTVFTFNAPKKDC